MILVKPFSLSLGSHQVPGITWVYDVAKARWEARTSDTGPRPFPYSGFTYDPGVKKCIYFNGHGETWTYDAAKDVWTHMQPAMSAPPACEIAESRPDAS